MLARPVAAALLAAPLALLPACKKGSPSGEPDASAGAPALTAGELCDLVFGAAARQLSASCAADEQQKKQYTYLVGHATSGVARCKEELEPLVSRGSVRVDAEAARRCGKLLEATSWKERFASPDLSRFAECRGLLLGAVAEGQPCEAGFECGTGLVCAPGAEGRGRCEKPGGAPPACPKALVATLAASSPCGPGMVCPTAPFRYTVLGTFSTEPLEAAPPDRPAQAGMLGLLKPAPNRAGIDALEGQDGIGGAGGHHRKPQVRMGATEVSGRLPPEVIQRIVRQNFGRFRLCYENGLRSDPRLRGKVAVRFVIGRDGAVTSVADGGSEMPDAKVADCVIRAFRGLSFPQPEGGIVTVRYPMTFSPPDDADTGAAAPPPRFAPEPQSAPSAAPAEAAEKPSVCGPAHPAGEVCGAPGTCAAGLACRLHKCAGDPPAAAGGACMDESDCAAGLYCSRQRMVPEEGGTRGTCAPRKPEGAACTSSVQCGGLCLEGKCAAFCGAR